MSVREMLLHHTSGIDDPQQRVAQAREFLSFLANHCQEDATWRKMLKDELEHTNRLNDANLLHEHLEANNRPIYFHEFVDQIQAKRLQYLGEVEFPYMFPTSLTKTTYEALHEVLPEWPLIQREQYMDYLRNRKFRQTLLCHDAISLERELKSGILGKFHLSASGPVKEQTIDIHSKEEVNISIANRGIRTAHPLIKAALTCLNDVCPYSVSLTELHTAALGVLSPDWRQQEKVANLDTLAWGMLPPVLSGMIELSVHPPQCAVDVSRYPLASDLARRQAASGEAVTNRRHQIIRLDALARHIIVRLDGHCDRATISANIKEEVDSGVLVIGRRGNRSSAIDTPTLLRLIDGTLTQLCQSALLIA
jgi:methyltransferase-like protein